MPGRGSDLWRLARQTVPAARGDADPPDSKSRAAGTQRCRKGSPSWEYQRQLTAGKLGGTTRRTREARALQLCGYAGGSPGFDSP